MNTKYLCLCLKRYPANLSLKQGYMLTIRGTVPLVTICHLICISKHGSLSVKQIILKAYLMETGAILTLIQGTSFDCDITPLTVVLVILIFHSIYIYIYIFFFF